MTRFLTTILVGGIAAGGMIAAPVASPAGPVRIFLLAGQSNMTGRGWLGNLNAPAADQKASLVRYIKDPKHVEKYKYLYDGIKKDPNGWTVRNDVFVSYGEWPHPDPGQKEQSINRKHGALCPGYGGTDGLGFGPEFGIGHVLGDYYADPVLLVKLSYGLNSLAANFRPPSSGGNPGDKYPMMVKAVQDAIENLPRIIPGYDKRAGCQITGFFWNQGESDMNEKYAGEYEKNLVNLILDLRKEFKAPDMKSVIAVSGFGGWKDMLPRETHKDEDAMFIKAKRKVIGSQLAVAKRHEFYGMVAAVETREFWRDKRIHGEREYEIHWNGNGESYWLIGEAMGFSMVKLMKQTNTN